MSTTTAGNSAAICSVPGCGKSVPKQGHTLCYDHWKAVKQTQDSEPPPKKVSGSLTSTKLGDKLNLSASRMNQVLSELGWIEKKDRGWVTTEQGKKLLAEVKTANNGIPYVVWPEAILTSRILSRAVSDLQEPEPVTTVVQDTQEAVYGSSFRKRFPATHRTSDGHKVRSKAEQLIDDWLYMTARLPHAYERRVPIEEDLYCDFFLPEKKVYIEYWGMENDPAYLSRKDEKVGLYAKYGLNLVQLTDEHVKNLDDHLPKVLLKFGIHID